MEKTPYDRGLEARKDLLENPAWQTQEREGMESVPCPVCQEVAYDVYSIVDGAYRFCRCLRCKSIYQNPRLDESAIQALYGEAYFATTNVHSGYLNYSDTLEQQKRTAVWLWNQIERLTGKTAGPVLDVGCGSGEFLKEGMRRHLECWGTDIYASSAEPPYRFIAGDFTKVDLPKNFFDLIVFNDSFEHFLAPDIPLMRCAEILRPGGHLVINTPDPDGWLAKIWGRNWISLKHEHLVIYPRRVLTELLRRYHLHNPKRIASRQYADWNYLKPRLERLSPALAALAGRIVRLFAEKYFLVPTGGMIMTAKKGAP